MAAPIANDWGSRSHVQTLVLMVVTAFGIYLCYRLAAPFLPSLAWALALAVLFAPFQRWLESKLRRPSLAAVVSVLVIGLIVVVPATFVAQRLVLQAAKGAELIETKVNSGEWRQALEAQPRLAPLADMIERQMDLPGTVKTLATWLSTTAGSIPGAKHIFLPELVERRGEIDASRPVAVHCASGYRASLAASILQKEGFQNVANIPGSWQAWQKAGYPVEKGQ